MAYLDSLSASSRTRDQVAALLFPLWEQTTPQYPQPNPYELANAGYRRNELVYACINKWMKAVAEAPLHIYKREKVPTDLEQHPLRGLMRKPNPYMSENTFWRVTQMFLKIAGFAAWEKERNRLGEVIALWPMSPHWCAFRRGPGKPIAWVEYKPWGIELAPVPIERVLLFQYIDPLAPLVKALSPSAVSSRVGAVDNNTTDFLKLFMEHGAVVNGLLKTERTLDDAEAEGIRRMWHEQHGGFQNWTDPAVLGYGMSYQPTQMDFRQMTFGELDARGEARICQAMDMPPILVGAKVGLDRATYANYKEARSAWYEESVTPEWDFLEDEVETQLLPDFENAETASDLFVLDFDISQVRALQEDRSAKWTRATTAFEKNIITRDEAREEMDLDPIDDDQVFSSDTKPAPLPPGPGAAGPGDGTEPPALDATSAAQDQERKQFRVFAAKRRREGAPERIAEFKFRFLSKAEQARLLKGAQDGETSEDPFEFGSPAHARHMRKFERRVAKPEARLQKTVTALIERQRDAILERMPSESKALPDLGNPEDWQAEWVEELKPVLQDIVADAAGATIKDYALGISFDVLDPRVTRFVERRAQRFAQQVNRTTWSRLRDSLNRGIANGESIAELAERVSTVMEDRIRSSAETIARTETISAFNAGTAEAWQQSGVVSKKGWLATLDPRTREAHAEAHGQVVGLDEPFIVGGEALMYPGDSSGSPDNIINCRCTMYAVVE